MHSIKYEITILTPLPGPVAKFCQPEGDGATTGKGALQLVSEHARTCYQHNHPDVLASGNRSGFETGHVVKMTMYITCL